MGDGLDKLVNNHCNLVSKARTASRAKAVVNTTAITTVVYLTTSAGAYAFRDQLGLPTGIADLELIDYITGVGKLLPYVITSSAVVGALDPEVSELAAHVVYKPTIMIRRLFRGRRDE